MLRTHYVVIGLYVIVVASVWLCVKSDDELIMSHVIVMSGLRNPYKIHPESPDKDWAGGLAALQQAGINYLYAFGKLLKTEYVDVLKIVSQPIRNFYVRSNNSERSLMSALSLLAGMFQPNKENSINGELLWQPIPVQTVPKEDDFLLRTMGNNCPKRDFYFNEVYTSSEWLEYAVKNEEFLNFFYKKTGYVDDLTKVWDIYDEVRILMESGKKVPEWITEYVLNQLAETTKFILSKTYASSDTRIQQVLVGHLFYRMVNHMALSLSDNIQNYAAPMLLNQQQDNIPTQQHKLYLYFIDETGIYAILSALGIPEKDILPFSTTLALNLYKVTLENNQVIYSIKIMINKKSQTWEQLVIPKCNKDMRCTLENLIDSLAHIYVYDDPEKECKMSGNTVAPPRTTHRTSWTNVAVACYAGVVSLLLLLSSMFIVYQTKPQWILRRPYLATTL